jgi:uncharacterized protein YndB with AHSA1/START domain
MLAKPSLTLKRRLKATPKTVFAAWIEPAQIANWFGPEGAEVLTAEIDPRKGGSFHITFTTPDGEDHDISGTYLEFVRDRKLVFTWRWITLPERQSQVTLTLEPDGKDATLLTLLHEQLFDEAAKTGHTRGWTQSLDKLEKLFA